MQTDPTKGPDGQPATLTSILSYNLDDQLSSETYDANGNAIQLGTKSFPYDSES